MYINTIVSIGLYKVRTPEDVRTCAQTFFIVYVCNRIHPSHQCYYPRNTRLFKLDFTYKTMGSMDSWCLYSYFLYLNCLKNNNLSLLIDKYPTRTQPLLHLLLNNLQNIQDLFTQVNISDFCNSCRSMSFTT